MQRFYLILIFGFLPTLCLGQAPKVDFAKQVLPILSDKCFVCHGPDSEAESDLRLDSFDAATSDRGGYFVINTENPSESEFLERIHSDDDPMPPQSSRKQLSESEKNILTQWVKQGGKYTKHWAFVKPVRPKLRNSTLAQNPIDTFVAKQLSTKKIDFAPEAEKHILARRTALVLTGLPPDQKLLDAFMNDRSKTAFEDFVDQLLAHPRFGEHQARFWLDAVRYGDTHGLHLDNRRGIYPYRDWVVKAFNDNLPLNDFITWQVAGDLLPNPTLEQLVATGYVRMNLSTSEGGAIPAEFQAKNNFDRVETLGTSLLGLSLICARCHTHKYDPITQTEYYELFAFFNNTAEGAMDGNSYTYGPTVRAPSNQADWRKWELIENAFDEITNKADEAIKEKHAAEWEQWNRLSKNEKMKWIAEERFPAKDIGLVSLAKTSAQYRQEVESRFTTTLIARELPKPRETKLLKRGEYNLRTGNPLMPGFLSALETEAAQPTNRLDLARWLTSKNNPLVSRVIVNQIWQRIFGDGLVRTPEDFGLQGQQPTHPDLLDWLAVELQESGWDQKALIKKMVLSRTFRQSSRIRTDVDDPENKLFAPAPEYADFKAEFYARLDPRFKKYFSSSYDATIRLDEILWGGVKQDGIPPLDQPEVVSADAPEAEYLADSNVVFGVQVNGQPRCLPQTDFWPGMKMVKDTVGGRVHQRCLLNALRCRSRVLHRIGWKTLRTRNQRFFVPVGQIDVRPRNPVVVEHTYRRTGGRTTGGPGNQAQTSPCRHHHLGAMETGPSGHDGVDPEHRTQSGLR